jgi:hypothetical protein
MLRTRESLLLMSNMGAVLEEAESHGFVIWSTARTSLGYVAFTKFHSALVTKLAEFTGLVLPFPKVKALLADAVLSADFGNRFA